MLTTSQASAAGGNWIFHVAIFRFAREHVNDAMAASNSTIPVERSLARNLNPSNAYSSMPFLLLGEPMRIQHVYNQNHHQQYTLVSYSLCELQLIDLLF
jgi:hypothetical protein